MLADLIVAGAGPVGLGVAIEAAAAGMRVVVLDPREPPIDKACGEGLTPRGRLALARLGVEPPGVDLDGIRYLDAARPGRQAVARFAAGPGMGVRRTALSEALAARAGELGVRRLVGRVLVGTPQVELSPGGVRVAHDGVPGEGLRARWLVAADGLGSPTRRALGLDAPPPGPWRSGLWRSGLWCSGLWRSGPRRHGQSRHWPRRHGLRRHYRIEPWSRLVEVHWAVDAEAYVTPVAPDLVGVAVLCSRSGVGFDAWLARFPLLAGRLSGARPATSVRGAGPMRRTARARVRGPVLLAGDAAGYVDALTGEGVSVGLAGARELVACLAAGRPEDYEAAWRRVTRRYRVLTSALVGAGAWGPSRAAIVPAARYLPAAFGAIVNRLD